MVDLELAEKALEAKIHLSTQVAVEAHAAKQEGYEAGFRSGQSTGYVAGLRDALNTLRAAAAETVEAHHSAGPSDA